MKEKELQDLMQEAVELSDKIHKAIIKGTENVVEKPDEYNVWQYMVASKRNLSFAISNLRTAIIERQQSLL